MSGVVERLGVVAKGVLIGCAEVIPSVSGGTIALLTGVWSRAVLSLASFGWESLTMLARGELGRFWRQHHMGFLTLLFVGSLIGLFALARLVDWVLANEPSVLMALIVGIIIGSTPLMLRSLGAGVLKRHWLGFAGGILLGLGIGLLPTGNLEASLPLILVSAMLASCAALLPGLSGAYILLIIGVYDEAVRAVSEFDLTVLVTLFAGVVCGLLAFSRIVRRLLASHGDATLTLMLGMVVGSLYKVFPSDVDVTRVWGLAGGMDAGLPLGTCVAVMVLGGCTGVALAKGSGGLKMEAT